MPFDTVGRSQKRLKCLFSPLDDNEQDDLYSPFDFQPSLFMDSAKFNSKDSTLLHSNSNRKFSNASSKEEETLTVNSSPPPTISDLIESSHLQSSNNDLQSSVYSHSSAMNSSFWNQPKISIPSTNELDIWSKFNLSYTDVGINMEANVTSASDLHSLIDAFSKLCNTTPVVSHDPFSHSMSLPPQSPITISGDEYNNSFSSNQSVASSSSGITLCRNKSHKLKPINYFASVGRLGQLTHPHSKHGQISLKQITDACVDTYFKCWVRNTPILRKEEFMTWYEAQPDPMNTLIVNAMCVCVFRHMVLHHSQPGLEHFVGDQDKTLEQEEYFFEKARECLSQSFDNPDRFTIIGLLFIIFRAEPSRRHHYAGMAVSALHELEIYPRTIDEADDESYEKEMDTRLWWFVWAWDFYLYSSGNPKNTPQPRIPGSEIDLPRIMEQDIDDDEIAVIAYIHCLRLWKIQAHFISTVYEQESDMTVEQLQEYDRQLLAFYAELPEYLKFDSGFEYGHEDLLLACIRVNIEYNATRIILHKLFVPDITDSRPSKSSLESLNICLEMALKQLPTLNSHTFLPDGRCAFDRDELWRASEIISMAMDIYRTCASIQDRAIILQNISAPEFENGLTRALDILKSTMEFETLSRNWIQVADWLEVEIRRHELYSGPRLRLQENAIVIENRKHPNFFLANLKSDAEQKRRAGMIDTVKTQTDLIRRMSTSSTISMENAPLASPPLTLSPPSSTSSSSSSSSYPPSTNQYIHYSNISSPHLFMEKPSQLRKPTAHFNNNTNTMQFVSTTFSASPNTTPSASFVQYNPHSSPLSSSPSLQQSNMKTQPKFRYFSPRKMNKFMFIDDNPMS
jgi:hypothetical protein